MMERRRFYMETKCFEYLDSEAQQRGVSPSIMLEIIIKSQMSKQGNMATQTNKKMIIMSTGSTE